MIFTLISVNSIWHIQHISPPLYKGYDSHFVVKEFVFFINMQFAYTNFISCQATWSSSYLFESRI